MEFYNVLLSQVDGVVLLFLFAVRSRWADTLHCDGLLFLRDRENEDTQKTSRVPLSAAWIDYKRSHLDQCRRQILPVDVLTVCFVFCPSCRPSHERYPLGGSLTSYQFKLLYLLFKTRSFFRLFFWFKLEKKRVWKKMEINTPQRQDDFSARKKSI